MIKTLCQSAHQFSAKISHWEQGELIGNILSLMESTDSEDVILAGLQVYIAMLESSFLLEDDISSRLMEVKDSY